jgi:predicted nucleotidyltransferase
MTERLERHRAEIEEACRRFGVRRLEVFGSVTGSDFDERTSDVDSLVEFEAQEAPNLCDRYFGLSEALMDTLGRKVRSGHVRRPSKPYFVDAANQTRQTFHASQSANTARGHS